jgi:hypothetical protein
MVNILDLQGLSVADVVSHDCPSSRSIIVVITTFRP